jgi:hypothetical protein
MATSVAICFYDKCYYICKKYIMQNNYQKMGLSDLEGEIWKPITQYNGAYQVSNLGRIKSLARTILFNHPKFGESKISYHEKIMKQVEANGYLMIGLYDENGKNSSFRVHRLIMIAFVSNPENKPFVNHIDGNKLNNNLSNLEWCTSSENMVHAYKHGLSPKISGKDHHQSKTVYQYDFSGNLLGTYGSCGEASRATGYNGSQINKVCMGKLRFYKDNVWSYIELEKEFFNREFRKSYDKEDIVVQYDYYGKELKRYRNAKEAARESGIQYILIYQNLTHRTKTAKGYRWVYAKNLEQ